MRVMSPVSCQKFRYRIVEKVGCPAYPRPSWRLSSTPRRWARVRRARAAG